MDLYALYKQGLGKHRKTLNSLFFDTSHFSFKVLFRYFDYDILNFLVGDCNIDQPGMTELKAKAKWDAWNAKKGVSQDEAKSQYVELANKMIEKHGTT